MSRPRKLKPVRVPKYCLHKPTGQAYVTLGGKMIYLGRYKLADDGRPDCPEYHRLIAEWLANGRTVPVVPTVASPLTIAELLLAYWTHAQAYYKKPDGKASGELEAIRHALRPVKRLFETMPAAEFGPKKIKMVRDDMKKMGWCRTNVNRQISRVKRCFKWGVEEELIPGSVHHALSAVRALRCNPEETRESEPVRAVPHATIEAVLPFLSPTVAAMVQIQLKTGMRPGELVIMRMRDIEMDGDRWTYRPSSHKNSHRALPREVTLGPVARELLRPFLKPMRLDAFLFDPHDATDRAGERYTVGSYRRAIARACDQAFPLPQALEADWQEVNAFACAWAYKHDDYRPRLGEYPPALLEKRQKIEAFRADHRWHPHQLRHTAAGDIRKRFGLEQARTVLGHSDTTMTATYAEEDREKARDIMEQVG